MSHVLRGGLLLLLLLLAGVVRADSPPILLSTPAPEVFAYVTNAVSDTVTVFNAATRTLVATIPVGANPFGIAVTPNGKFAYVANHDDNTVSVISTCSNTVIATIPVGVGPADVAVSPDGSLVLVTNNSDCSVSVIDTLTNTVFATIPEVCMPFGVTFTPDGTKAYVSNYGSLVTGDFGCTVTVIDIATLTKIKIIPVGNYPMGVVVTPDGGKLYVSDYHEGLLSIIDTAADTVVKTKTIGDGPFNLAVTPDGAYVYNTLFNQNQVAVIDTVTDTMLPSLYDTDDCPTGIAVTPEGSEVWVTNYVSDSLSIIDVAANTVDTIASGGMMPFDLAFAVRKPCRALGAVVYWDKDDSATYNSGDSLLQNWTVTLTDADGNTKTALTDANGYVQFTGLKPGAYTLAETLQNGWYNTTPLSVAVTVPADADPADTYFGNNLARQRVVAYKWKDCNKDGIWQDGEAPISGWTIEVVDAAGALVASGQTDGIGKIVFELLPGEYTVREVMQAGWINVTPVQAAVTVAVGQSPAPVCFGNIPLPKQRIIVYKFKDCDRDGCWDCGEPAIAGWTIQLYDAVGALIATQQTNSCGKVEFLVLPGSYVVKEVMQDGWVNIRPIEKAVTVVAGSNPATVYFGNAPIQKQRITAYKFKDCDRDGGWDCGEPAIANWTIQLYDGAGALLATQQTDSCGKTEFLVLPGSYVVKEVMQAGWVNTRPIEKAVTVVAGSNPATVYFGNTLIQKQRITAYKWKDCNRNRSWDCYEPAIAYWSIQLYDAAGNLIATQQTNCSGKVEFLVLPGTYTVKEVMRSGWVNITPLQYTVVVPLWKDPATVYFGNMTTCW